MFGLAGPDARDRGGAALPARRPAFRIAGQGPAVRLRDDRGGRRGGSAVHVGNSDRHRRDPARAPRGPAAACATSTNAYGHLQEIIIQNFRAKAGTRMADHAEPDAPRPLWTIAAARILFGPDMNIQAPPNLIAVGAAPTDRCRHQRLGWGFSGDARPRQSGAALAALGHAGARDARGRQGAGRAPGDLSGSMRATPTRWVDPNAANGRLARLRRARASHAAMRGFRVRSTSQQSSTDQSSRCADSSDRAAAGPRGCRWLARARTIS